MSAIHTTMHRSTGPLLEQLRAWSGFFAHPITILRGYRSADLPADLIAGLTVAMVAVPQAIAYALIADLPPHVGLYTAIVGAIVGALWGSSHHLQTGPTNASSLLILPVLLAVATPGTPEYLVAASMIAIMAGIAKLLAGLARLGLLINFVSDSVVIGFTSGAGLLIVANQLRHLLRLNIPSTSALDQTLHNVVTHLPQTHLPSLLLGVGTLVTVMILRRIDRRIPNALIALTLAALVAAFSGLAGEIKVVGALPRGLPPLKVPPLTDLRLIGELSTTALAVAAFGLIETTSVARGLAAATRQRLDSNQEFVGQGLAGIACGLFSGYPPSGSLARSALNVQAGARTALSNVFCGFFVLLALLAFGPLAAHIPLAALAGLVISAAAGLIDRREMTRIWQSGGGDRSIMVVTLLATLLLPLQIAVLSGILMSLGYYLLKTSTPRVRTVLPDDRFEHLIHRPDKPSCPQLGIIEILGDLYFGAAHHVEDCIERNLAENPGQRFLLLRMQSVERIDISGIHTLENVLRIYRERGGDLFLTRVRSPVAEVMRASHFERRLGADHFLPQDSAVSHLFHHELDPAICIYECPVRAFRECQNLPKYLSAEEHGSIAGLRLPAVPKQIEDALVSLGPEAVWGALHTATPPLIVDVREPREFRRGHIPGARSLPLSALLAEPDLTGLDELVRQDRLVVFVCRGGRRSRRVAALAVARGGRHIAYLRGGMLAWEAARLLEAVDSFD